MSARVALRAAAVQVAPAWGRVVAPAARRFRSRAVLGSCRCATARSDAKAQRVVRSARMARQVVQAPAQAQAPVAGQ